MPSCQAYFTPHLERTLHMLQGYGPDAVASATNTLDSGSRKGVQEAVQKAGHILPAANGNATMGTTRATAGARQNKSWTENV